MYSMWGMKKLQKIKNNCNVCYFHPWEIDHEQPFFEKLDRLTQIRHYSGTKKLEKVLDTMLSNFKFETFAERALKIHKELLEKTE